MPHPDDTCTDQVDADAICECHGVDAIDLMNACAAALDGGDTPDICVDYCYDMCGPDTIAACGLSSTTGFCGCIGGWCLGGW
jgi:hypothetical protein